MSTINIFSRSLLIAALVPAIILVLPIRSASAQAYLSQLTYLEQFAVNVYNRGDHAQAAREFNRILTIDPSSKTARDYLDKIAQGSGSGQMPDTQPSTDRTASITSDIISLREDALRRENDLVYLSALIRNLITENDNLYMVLNKRSREVIDLRSKLFGISDIDQYAAVMAALPPQRVPQNALRLDAGLSETGPVPANRSESVAEYDTLLNDIGELSIDISKSEQTFATMNAEGKSPDAQLIRALDEKRSALLQKNLLLISKSNRMEDLRKGLTATQSDLQTINARYQDLLKKIERAMALKATADKTPVVAAALIPAPVVMVTPGPAAQPIIPAIDITPLTNEIADLKQQISRRETSLNEARDAITSAQSRLTTLQTAIATKDAEIAGLNQKLASRDNELADLNATLELSRKDRSEKDALLTQKNDEINRQKEVITTTWATMSITESGLAEAASRLERIEASAAEIETSLAKNNPTLWNLVENKDRLTAEQRKSDLLSQELLSRKTDLMDARAQLQRSGSLTRTLGQTVSSLESTAQQNSADLASLGELARKSEQENIRRNDELARQKELLTALQARIHQMDLASEELRAGIRSGASSLEALDAELHASRKERRRLERVLAEQEDSLMKLSAHSIDSEAERYLVSEELRLTQKEANELRQQNTAATLKAELDDSQKKIDATKQALSGQDAAIDQLSQALSAAQAKAGRIDELAKERTLLSRQVTELTQQLNEARTAEQTQTRNARELRSALQERTLSARAGLDIASDQVARAKVDMHSMTTELQTKQQELEQIQARLKECETAGNTRVKSAE